MTVEVKRYSKELREQVLKEVKETGELVQFLVEKVLSGSIFWFRQHLSVRFDSLRYYSVIV